MISSRIRKSRNRTGMVGFNMTPMIDVIFLLIVFFMLICQFISQDFERLSVPDNCVTAADGQVDSENEIVIQVYDAGPQTGVVYSIQQRDFTGQGVDSGAMISDMSKYLLELSQGKETPIVRLRGDGRLSCTQVRPAIKAAAAAGLANVRFAAFKDAQPE